MEFNLEELLKYCREEKESSIVRRDSVNPGSTLWHRYDGEKCVFNKILNKIASQQSIRLEEMLNKRLEERLDKKSYGP